jgi:hypothetical protein
MTTYFVSAEIGSNTYAGTSATAPLATLQAAENLVKAGDTVEVMNGTYTGSPGGNLLQITTSGTSGSPITFEAAPGQTPVLNTSGEWNGILVQASYINIKGLTVVGDAASYTLAKAEAVYGISNPNVDGNGIVVESAGGGQVPNHITIQNNTVYDEPGGGIGVIGADYVQILNNTVHDNAHWSAYGNSGISIASSVNLDTKSGVHDTISGNTSYNNTELVPYYWTGTITDGEGIILDTNTGFTGEILVQGNTTYGNSGAGIESFLTNNAVINSNVSYGNLTNPAAAGDGQIFINQSKNDTVTNNTTIAPGGGGGGGGSAPPTNPTPVSAGTGPDTLVLQISENAYANGDGTSDAAGDARFTVSVDGQQVGGTFTALASHSAGQNQAFSLSGDWTPMQHTVTVHFLNGALDPAAPDANGSDERSLYVNSVTYDGANTSQSAALTASGGVNFKITDHTTSSAADTITLPAAPTVTTVSRSNVTVDAGGHYLYTVTVDGTHDAVNLTAGSSDTISALLGSNVITTGGANDHITFAGSNNIINAGSGINSLTDEGTDNTIILPGTGQNNDNIYGNVLTNGDTLDFRSALLGTNWDGLTSDVGNYLHVTQYDGDAIVSLSKTSGASGSTVAYLHGAGTVSLSTLLAHSLV